MTLGTNNWRLTRASFPNIDKPWCPVSAAWIVIPIDAIWLPSRTVAIKNDMTLAMNIQCWARLVFPFLLWRCFNGWVMDIKRLLTGMPQLCGRTGVWTCLDRKFSTLKMSGSKDHNKYHILEYRYQSLPACYSFRSRCEPIRWSQGDLALRKTWVGNEHWLRERLR